MRTSTSGVRFIAGFEGFRGRPYNDAAGHATIGYGHLLHRGPVTHADLVQWNTLTVHAAEHLLAKDLRLFERGVEQLVTTKITQGQFDALVSFAFNVGLGALRSSALLRQVNQRHWWRAWREFRKWNRAGGHVLAGLDRRRLAERRLFIRSRPRRRT